jgi:hypothetical protein
VERQPVRLRDHRTVVVEHLVELAKVIDVPEPRFELRVVVAIPFEVCAQSDEPVAQSFIARGVQT